MYKSVYKMIFSKYNIANIIGLAYVDLNGG